MSHKSNTCSVFALQVCLHIACIHMGPCLHDQLNAKDADIKKVTYNRNSGEIKYTYCITSYYHFLVMSAFLDFDFSNI